MKILFVSRGFDNSPKIIVENQGRSLSENGVIVNHFLINKKGFVGYIKAIKPLRKVFLSGQYDLVHAHYSFSAFVASLAGVKPLVVSLMGSDVKKSFVGRFTITVFRSFFSWKAIITKSEDSKKSLWFDSVIIPNGVNFSLFKPLDKILCQERIGWDSEYKHILFAADPDRFEKNYKLASAAFDLLEKEDFKIHFLKSVPNAETVYWYNAADVILLTSLWEGSPNVIKEAMACCRPIITTPVGDVENIIGLTESCFVVPFDENIIAEKISFFLRNNDLNIVPYGRSRLIELGYDSNSIASKLIKLYKSVLENGTIK